MFEVQFFISVYIYLLSVIYQKSNQVWRPLAVKRDNLALPAQGHVIAPLISYLRSSDASIQNVSNKQVIRDFLEKCTKILS